MSKYALVLLSLLSLGSVLIGTSDATAQQPITRHRLTVANLQGQPLSITYVELGAFKRLGDVAPRRLTDFEVIGRTGDLIIVYWSFSQNNGGNGPIRPDAQGNYYIEH